MRAINILENPGEFYDLCVKEGWTDESEEDLMSWLCLKEILT